MEIRDRIKEFRRIKGAELHDNPKNWREHPPAQQTAMLGILREVGVADVLLVRETDEGYQLIDGHLRRNLEPDVDWPCAVLDVDEVEADLILATHDPLAAMAEQNDDRLRELLDSFSPDSEELQKMLDDLKPIEPVEIIQDEVPEVSESEAITKPGDLWLLGEHRLLCGDSTKAEDVGRLLDGRKPFIMVTDPPYGVDHNPHWREEAGVSTYGPQAKGLVNNDDRVDWMDAFALFPGDVLYAWHASWFIANVATNIDEIGFERRCLLIWMKQHFAMSRGHYHWQHEPCWYAVRSGGTAKWCGDRTQSTIWEIKSMHVMGGARGDADNPVTGHSTQKPVECMARPIRNHGDSDDDVYDPFVGSGTTIIAAEQLGRRCYACEIEPRYVDVAVQRWETLTGQEATLSNGA